MAECPFCDYEDSSTSVEAHVSGSTDDAHQGKLGSNYRGIIDATVGEPSEPDAGDDDQPADLPSGLALMAATAALAIIVIAGSTGSGGSVEESDAGDDQGADPMEGWA